MNNLTKGNIVLILAVIGALVVAGWVLKIAFALLGPLLLLGLGGAVYLMIANDKGGRS